MEEKIVVETPSEVTELQQKIAEYEAQVKNLKNTLSERNSEAAQRKRESEEWKKKFEATMDEQQLAESKRKEKEEATLKELAELKRDNSINKYKAKYLSMGYTEDLAQSSAEAKVDGNDEVLFQNESLFIQKNIENTKAELLKAQPSISSGKPIGAEEAQKIRDEKLRRYAGL